MQNYQWCWKPENNHKNRSGTFHDCISHEFHKELWSEILDIANKVKSIKEDTGDVMDHVPGGPGGVVILENSPVGESESNGSVEIAIREVQNQVRKLKDQT